MKFTVDLDHMRALGIKMNEYVFLKEVSILQAWEIGYCTKSNGSFAEDYGMSRSAIIRMAQRLEEKGLLKQGKGTYKRATDKFLQGVAKSDSDSSETLQLGVAKRDTRRSETLHKTRIETGKETLNKYTDEFERFWSTYGKVGNKRQAYKLWCKLSAEEKNQVMASLPKYKAYLAASGISPKHATTYLNKDNAHWETDWQHMKVTYAKGKDQKQTATTISMNFKNVKNY